MVNHILYIIPSSVRCTSTNATTFCSRISTSIVKVLTLSKGSICQFQYGYELGLALKVSICHIFKRKIEEAFCFSLESFKHHVPHLFNPMWIEKRIQNWTKVCALRIKLLYTDLK